jgi:hypothetical protein
MASLEKPFTLIIANSDGDAPFASGMSHVVLPDALLATFPGWIRVATHTGMSTSCAYANAGATLPPSPPPLLVSSTPTRTQCHQLIKMVDNTGETVSTLPEYHHKCHLYTDLEIRAMFAKAAAASI